MTKQIPLLRKLCCCQLCAHAMQLENFSNNTTELFIVADLIYCLLVNLTSVYDFVGEVEWELHCLHTSKMLTCDR